MAPIGDDEMVHPSQVVSQFTYFAKSPDDPLPAGNNILFIPYFLHLADHPDALAEATAALLGSESTAVPFLGHRMNMSRLTVVHLEWIIKQIARVEFAVWPRGGVRPEVRRYLEAVQARCQGARGLAGRRRRGHRGRGIRGLDRSRVRVRPRGRFEPDCCSGRRGHGGRTGESPRRGPLAERARRADRSTAVDPADSTAWTPSGGSRRSG